MFAAKPLCVLFFTNCICSEPQCLFDNFEFRSDGSYTCNNILAGIKLISQSQAKRSGGDNSVILSAAKDPAEKEETMTFLAKPFVSITPDARLHAFHLLRDPSSSSRLRMTELLSAEQFAHQRFFFLQLGDRFVDLVPAEFVEWNFLHNFPFAAAHADWE